MSTATYTVTWSCPFDAESPEDAAEQAWAAIEDAIKGGGPTSVLTVRDEADAFAGRFDMAYDPAIEMDEAQSREIAFRDIDLIPPGYDPLTGKYHGEHQRQDPLTGLWHDATNG